MIEVLAARLAKFALGQREIAPRARSIGNLEVQAEVGADLPKVRPVQGMQGGAFTMRGDVANAILECRCSYAPLAIRDQGALSQ